MHVHVDKAGDDVLAGQVQDLAALRGVDARAHLGDRAVVGDEDVADPVGPDLRVDDMASLKQ